jgi:hypothetical protein
METEAASTAARTQIRAPCVAATRSTPSTLTVGRALVSRCCCLHQLKPSCSHGCPMQSACPRQSRREIRKGSPHSGDEDGRHPQGQLLWRLILHPRDPWDQVPQGPLTQASLVGFLLSWSSMLGLLWGRWSLCLQSILSVLKDRCSLI